MSLYELPVLACPLVQMMLKVLDTILGVETFFVILACTNLLSNATISIYSALSSVGIELGV
jgi:hypothetical protein